MTLDRSAPLSYRNGYKMCIRAYFVLVKGEYDPLLKWPFDNKVSLILIDQNHRKHVVQTLKGYMHDIT